MGLVSAASSSSGREVPHPTEAPLLPKLRGQFAEFLNQGSLDRLGILYLPTCVGLGYGHLIHIARGFSRQHGISRFASSGSASGLRISSLPDLPRKPPYTLAPGTTIAWVDLPSCVPPSLSIRRLGRVRPEGQPPIVPRGIGRVHGGTGISTCCASTTPCGLALAPD